LFAQRLFLRKDIVEFFNLYQQLNDESSAALRDYAKYILFRQEHPEYFE